MSPLAGLPHVEMQSESEEVYEQLAGALAELQAPLGELVRAQMEDSLSLPRIAIVLAAGYRQPDSTQLRTQRIFLAAALEMLHLALHIHKLLLQPGDAADEQAPDKIRMGSLILAGDYCFSRAASLAARTDEPTIVDIFARTLKTISEAHLRQLFHAAQNEFAEEEELVSAGLVAATFLARLPAEQRERTIALGQELLRNGELSVQETPSFQRVRWETVASVVGQCNPEP